MDTNGLRVAFIGNFGAPHSTENDLLHAMRANGMTVHCYSEIRSDNDVTDLLRDMSAGIKFDFVLWTSTKAYRDQMGDALQWELIARGRDVPIVAYHLDRWWGLEREHWLNDPYYQINLVVTADGGHDDMWPTKNIRHRWLPPGVSERWCQPGMFRDEYACDVVFVGNWDPKGGYHPEWRHRYDLIRWLNDNYGSTRGGHRGLRFFPKTGHPSIRGLELNDVYASARVVVGDSCLVPRRDGQPITRYCSDRVPETLGRGGILFHPSVEGIDRTFERYVPWELNNWGQLREAIDAALEGYDDDDGWAYGSVEAYRLASIDFIKANHTYEVRVRQLVDIMHEEGLL